MVNKMKTIPKLLQVSEEVSRKNVFERIVAHLKGEKIVKEKSNKVKICFLIDATGSMKQYTTLVKDTIKKIVKYIQEISIQINVKLQVSCCFYRDIEDQEKCGVLGFTSVLEIFEDYLSKIVTEGGGDQCEDVFIGFQLLNNELFEWNKEDMNFIFWIADAPCHGNKYHVKQVKDNFPDRKCNERVEEELKKIAQNNIHLFFLKVNNSTDQMIKVFNQIYQEFGAKELLMKKIKDINEKEFIDIIVKQYEKIQLTSSLHQVNFLFKNHKNLFEDKTLSNYRQSLLRSTQLLSILVDCSEEDKDLSQYDITADKIVNLKDIEFAYKGDALIKTYQITENKISELKFKNSEKIKIQISKKILNKGSFKNCFYAQNPISGKTYALKQMYRKMCSLPQNILFEVYINQLAKKCLEAFQEDGNKAGDHISQQMMIYIPDLNICEANGNIYLIEQLLDKNRFKKIINNDGTILQQNDPNCKVFESFIHYSYIFSGQHFIFTDLQGVDKNLVDIGICCDGIISNFSKYFDDKTKKEPDNEKIQAYFKKASKTLPDKIDLNDKQIGIHFPGNQGLQGIVSFFQNHKCNDICKALKLNEFSYEVCKSNIEEIEEYIDEEFESDCEKDQDFNNNNKTQFLEDSDIESNQNLDNQNKEINKQPIKSIVIKPIEISIPNPSPKVEVFKKQKAIITHRSNSAIKTDVQPFNKIYGLTKQTSLKLPKSPQLKIKTFDEDSEIVSEEDFEETCASSNARLEEIFVSARTPSRTLKKIN